MLVTPFPCVKKSIEGCLIPLRQRSTAAAIAKIYAQKIQCKRYAKPYRRHASFRSAIVRKFIKSPLMQRAITAWFITRKRFTTLAITEIYAQKIQCKRYAKPYRRHASFRSAIVRKFIKSPLMRRAITAWVPLRQRFTTLIIAERCPKNPAEAVCGGAKPFLGHRRGYKKVNHTIKNLDNCLSSFTEKKDVYQTVSPRKGFAPPRTALCCVLGIFLLLP
ncbi:MAG: hypothetical protein FWG99_02990 [Treponema sp.]|nr:hypothetical protein [Treponema sp.]